MAFVITSRKSKESKTRLLPFLPRIGITVDIAGKQFGYFQVPFLETLLNMRGKKWTVSEVVATAHAQIREIDLPNKAKKVSPPKSKRSKLKTNA